MKKSLVRYAAEYRKVHTKFFWHVRCQPMPYFPVIATAEPQRRYSFGEYRAILLDKVKSAQTIQYYFVLLVFHGQDETPCLAVASEYSNEETAAAPFLGVFPGDGHLNMGNSTDWLNLDKFATEAMTVALRHLDLPANQHVTVEERKQKKPWWKFW